MASGDIIRLGAYTGIDSFFGWAGAGFPYAGADDITISADTTWNDACGYKKVKKLTVDAGVTLKIEKSPFYIFCDELAGSGVIDISGASGTSSMIAHPTYLPRGGEFSAVTPYGQGGCGGGLIIICARLISGAVTIKANGGDGWCGSETASSNLGNAGHGAYSMNLTAPSSSYAGSYDGSTGSTSNGFNYLHPFGIFCGRGGSLGGRGGGNGSTGNGTYGGGGSGIGGGGAGSGESGEQPLRALTPYHVLQLALHGFLGGGGGGIQRRTTESSNGAGGGGGGAVSIWYKEKTATPTLEANGGTASGLGGDGAAGVTFLIAV